MQYLIKVTNPGVTTEPSPPFFVDFIKELQPPTPPPIRQRIPKPIEPAAPPPAPTPGYDNTLADNKVFIALPPIEGPEGGTGPLFAPGLLEGEPIAIVKPQPVYPLRAVERNIEGYTVVEYGITASGQTQNIRVLEAYPARIFDAASIQATARFKYKPRVVDGKAVEVHGIQNKFTFRLED